MVGAGAGTTATCAGVAVGRTPTTTAGGAAAVVGVAAAVGAVSRTVVPAASPAATRRMPLATDRSPGRGAADSVVKPARKVVVDVEVLARLACSRAFEAIRAWWIGWLILGLAVANDAFAVLEALRSCRTALLLRKAPLLAGFC